MKRIFISAVCLALMSPALFAADYLDRSAWSWSTSSECAAEEDITGLKGIYDGNTATCWHSNYHADNGTAERANPHWIMIDRGSDRSLVYGLSYVPRQNNGLNPSTACTEYAIYFADKSMSGTPATSISDIKNALGDPDASGTWTGDNVEKIVYFEKPVSARYILFVNVQSYSSKSAACAEMNLISKAGGSGVNPSNPGYNAIRIVTPEGESHRIAIDGEQLAFSMADGNIRMGNSSITVEYAMNEVKYFQPEEYDFADDEFYNGPKTDIYSQPVEISLDMESLTLEEGQSATLTATVRNQPEGAEPVWSSSNELVAVVDAQGRVMAVSPGSAVISVTCGEAMAECKLTVTPKPVIPVEISLNPASLTLEEGQSVSLSATVKNMPDEAEIVWASSDELVAVVDAQGRVTAVSPGSAVISVTCGEATAECKLTVTPKPVVPVEISLNSASLTLEEGKTFRLTATLLNAADYSKVTWRSSDDAVATVDSDGNVTAIKAGSATITASCGDASATCQVTVTAKPVEPGPGEDGISAPKAPTLTLKREGNNLIVGGLASGSDAVLYSLGGVKLCEASASDRGIAVLPVGALPRAAYLLSASGLTLKITF